MPALGLCKARPSLVTIVCCRRCPRRLPEGQRILLRRVPTNRYVCGLQYDSAVRRDLISLYRKGLLGKQKFGGHNHYIRLVERQP